VRQLQLLLALLAAAGVQQQRQGPGLKHSKELQQV
jgi:hypothetical protein